MGEGNEVQWGQIRLLGTTHQGAAMNKKIVPIILIITGAAFLFGAILFLLDNLTASEPVGLGKWIFDIFIALLGAGANIKGWMDLRKARSEQSGAVGKDQRIQEAIDSPDSEQHMEGKGGIQRQKSLRSPRSKQTMK